MTPSETCRCVTRRLSLSRTRVGRGLVVATALVVVSCRHDGARDVERASEPDAGGEHVPLAAPSLASLRVDAFATLPARDGAIPVLLFHGVCATTCRGDDIYELPREELARILAMIARAGYTTISPEQYSRFMNGETRGIPAQPILVTFDDGRLDAYLGADEILHALGARATMFVITERPESNASGFMSWNEIRRARASNRWDMQLHAGIGHQKIPSGLDEHHDVVRAPFYAVRRYDPIAYPGGDHMEPLAEWKARTERDIANGGALMTARLHDYRPWTFAAPFGDYGQIHGNDPAIAPTMRAYLDASFDDWFTQPERDPDFTVSSARTHERHRYTVLGDAKAEDVYAWLAKHAALPASPPAHSPLQ